MNSDFKEPLNIGSDEMVSMLDMGHMALEYAGKKDTVKINNIPGPEGVRGRNSDNTLIKVSAFFLPSFPSFTLLTCLKQVLGWAPNIALKDGLKRTFVWINEQVTK